MKNVMILLTTLAFMSFSLTVQAQYDSPAKKASYEMNAETIVDLAVGSADHETLVAALKAADLVNTLQGEGPFTVFAPTDAAFEALPDGTVSSLLKPENKSKLVEILTYHVVSGNLDSKAVMSAIKAAGGKAKVTTLSGGALTASIKDGNVYLKDEKGNWAKVTAVDLKGSNGVIHVIDTVVMPK